MHWGGGEVKWTVLGETGEQGEGYRKSQWWDGGVRSRTRSASRNFLGWWGGEGAERDLNHDADVLNFFCFTRKFTWRERYIIYIG